MVAHRRLEPLQDLESLRLRYSSVTDRGLKHLARVGSLTSLDLSDTHVTDKGLPALRPLKKLEWLDLCGTSTTEAGIKKFVQTMPRLVVHWREPSEDGGDDGEEKFFSAPRPGPWATSTPRPERPSSQTSVRPSESQRAASRRRSSARPWGVMGLGQSPY
jgi:hypothetical protein